MDPKDVRRLHLSEEWQSLKGEGWQAEAQRTPPARRIAETFEINVTTIESVTRTKRRVGRKERAILQ